jgi:hypothetical protein
VNLGSTVVVAPMAASSRPSRYCRTARGATSGSMVDGFQPSFAVEFCSLASASPLGTFAAQIPCRSVDQAGIRRKALAADQALVDAPRHSRLD